MKTEKLSNLKRNSATGMFTLFNILQNKQDQHPCLKEHFTEMAHPSVLCLCSTATAVYSVLSPLFRIPAIQSQNLDTLSKALQ